MVLPLDTLKGTFQPSEIDLLGRVIAKLTQPGMSEGAREALAIAVLAEYSAGVTDEAELLASLTSDEKQASA